jgi:D-3-phosphoglycerate dehydrogenase
VDLIAAKQSGIHVFNATDGPVQAVAELTLGHILSLLRNITSADRSMRSHCWSPQMGNLLSEQTVGVVGYGRIGRLVSQLCASFGAKVIAYDAYVSTCESNVSLVSFETILQQSDILTLHLPIDEFSWHIIGESQLAQMKRSALFLNMSRGGLIDERALYSALKNGIIRGAALDCYENEPYQGALLELDNVQFTAHMGSYARETRDLMEVEASTNLVNGLRKRGLI